MSAKFLLTAETVLTGPTNLQAYIANLNKALGNVTTTVNLKVNPQQLQQATQQMQQIVVGAGSASKAVKVTEDAFYKLGKAAAVSIRRFSSFVIATSAIRKVLSTFNEGVGSAIEYKDQLVRISQVTGTAVRDLRDLDKTVSSLSKTLGVNSEKLIESAEIFAQAGYQAREVKVAVDALAKAELAPTFGPDIKRNAEGLIAILKQFRLGVGDSERALGSINAVSKKFAIESDDIIEAVKRAGGAFSAAGGNLDEFNALMTSVRATTRESAESIATGLRTIFTRIQRVRTINFFEQLGLDLTDKGLFVGPYEAIRRLSEALKTIPTTDPRFAQIVEELGGFRQISKVIPLIREFTVAERARQISIAGGNSLTEDTIKRQQSLMIQLTKLKEEFFDFIRRGMDDTQIKLFIKTILSLSSALIKVADTLKTIAPLLALAFVPRLSEPLKSFTKGFSAEIAGTKFATGGKVPGVGNSDNVPALLTPGEFVIRKAAANKLGASFLQRLNNGSIPKFAAGGMVGSLNDITPTKLIITSVFASMASTKEGLSKDLKQLADIFSEFASKSAIYLYVFQQLKQLSSKVASSNEEQELNEIGKSTQEQTSLLGNIDKNVAEILAILKGSGPKNTGIITPSGPSGPSGGGNTPSGGVIPPKVPSSSVYNELMDLGDHPKEPYAPDKPLSLSTQLADEIKNIPKEIVEYLGEGIKFGLINDKNKGRGSYSPSKNKITLNAQNTKGDYADVLYHELGHAVDYRPKQQGGERLSESKKFIEAFNQDLANQSPEAKEKYDYYTKNNKEAFAELFAQQFGKSSLVQKGQSPAEFQMMFPNLNKFMQETVQELFGDLNADVMRQPGTSKALQDEIQHYMEQLPPALRKYLDKNNVKVMISRLPLNTAGIADYDKREIKLSQQRLSSYDPGVREGVLYHEIGHQYDHRRRKIGGVDTAWNISHNSNEIGRDLQGIYRRDDSEDIKALFQGSVLYDGSPKYSRGEIFAESFAQTLGKPSTLPSQSYTNQQFQTHFPLSMEYVRKELEKDGILGADQPKVESLTKDQLLRLAGAAPFKGAKAKFSYHEDGVTIDIYHHVLDGPMMTEIYNTPKGIAIENELLNVKPEFRGRGIATTSLLSQAHAANALGIDRINATGLRDSESFGYYALPRMGYDAKVRGPKGMTTLQELMQSEEGRQYWKQFGETTPMSFNTRSNSVSMAVLQKRMEEEVLGADKPNIIIYDSVKPRDLGPQKPATQLEQFQNRYANNAILTNTLAGRSSTYQWYDPPQGPYPLDPGSIPPKNYNFKDVYKTTISKQFGDIFSNLFSNTAFAALFAGAADTLGSRIQGGSADSIAAGNYEKGITQAAIGGAITDATRFASILSTINPVLGVFGGAVYGASSAFIQASIDIEKVKFAESFGRFRKMLDDFSNGTLSSNQVIVHFASNLKALENRIIETSAANNGFVGYLFDYATPLESAKSELENSLTTLQNVLSKTAENSQSIEQFQAIVGNDTIAAFARLTNQSIPKLTDSYKKQIDSQNAATKANKEFAIASADYINRVSNIQAFANSINNATSAVDNFGNAFSLESLAPQSNNGLFTQFNEKSLKRVQQLQSFAVGDFASEYALATQISDILPSLFAKIKVDPLGAEENNQDILAVVREELSRLTGADQTNPLITNVINAVKSEIGETGQSTKFLQKLEQNFPETLENVRKAITPLAEVFANIDTIVGGLRTNMQKLVGSVNALEVAIREKLLRAIDIREQAGIFNSKNDFTVKAKADAERRRLLTGGLNVNQLGQARLTAQNNVVRLNREIEQANAEEAVRLTAVREREQAIIERTNAALEFLADASTRNAHLQEELTRIEELRKNRGSFAADFAFSGGLKQAEIARTVLLAQRAAATGSIKGLGEEDRGAILNLFKQFGSDKLFAGLTGEEAIKKIVGKQFGQAGFGPFGQIIAGDGKIPAEVVLGNAINENFNKAAAAIDALRTADQEALKQLTTAVQVGFQDTIEAIFKAQFVEKDIQLKTQIAEAQAFLANRGAANNRLAGLGIQTPEQLQALKTNVDAAGKIRQDNAALNDAQSRVANAKKILENLFYNNSNAGNYRGPSGRIEAQADADKAIEAIRTELSGVVSDEELTTITNRMQQAFGNYGLSSSLTNLAKPGGSTNVGYDRNNEFAIFNDVLTDTTNNAVGRLAQTVQDTRTVVENIPAQLQPQVFGGTDEEYKRFVEQLNGMELTTNLQAQREELAKLEQQRKALLDAQTQQLNELERRRQAIGFNAGGLVPGTGNRDTQHTVLTPGEFVVNRQGVANLGANTLTAINSGIFSEKFNETIRVFSRSANALAGALNNFPSNVSHTINGKVEVIINGAEVLSKLGKPLQELIEGKITAAISKFAQDKFPDL